MFSDQIILHQASLFWYAEILVLFWAGFLLQPTLAFHQASRIFCCQACMIHYKRASFTRGLWLHNRISILFKFSSGPGWCLHKRDCLFSAMEDAMNSPFLFVLFLFSFLLVLIVMKMMLLYILWSFFSMYAGMISWVCFILPVIDGHEH